MAQKSEKLLTLVVPTYNMELYIARCLKTVTEPSVPDTLEVIVVNDGSKDKSLDIIRTFEQARPDIVTVIDKPNGHYGSCVNAGLKAATGKYFRMLDADDWVNTEALVALLGKLADCDADLVVTLRTEHITDVEKGQFVKTFPMTKVEYGKVYSAPQFDISTHTEKHEFNMHSMTYKTEILRQIGLRHLEGVCYTDLQYCFMPIDRIKSLVVYDLYLYQYFIGRDDQSTSAVSLRRNFKHICKVLRCSLDYMKSCGPIDEITRRNQHYFTKEAVDIFLASLRIQQHIPAEDYPTILGILNDIEYLDIRSKIYKKFYFKLWRRLKAYRTLKLTVNLYQKVHRRRLKARGL